MIVRPGALALCLTLASLASAQEPPKSQPSIWRAKPDVAAFEKMENDRLAAAQRDIDQLVSVTGPRTIANTLALYDEALAQLDAADNFATLMEKVNPDSAFRDRATAMDTKVSDAATALSLNPDVYKAIANLDLSAADSATKYYVQRQLLEFRLAGVDKDNATRARLKKLNDDLNQQQAMFERNIADDQKSIEVAGASELDGLPQDYIDRHKPGADGKIRISTNYPDSLPLITFAKNESVRREMYVAFQSRAYPKNRDVLAKMMQTRYEIGTLLGYSNWADYNAADKMMRNGKNIEDFIEQLNVSVRPAAERETMMLLGELQKTHPEAKQVWEYDLFYLKELVRRSQYDFDSETVRPYLPYNQVKQGILDTAAKLFRVTFRQETGAPVWAATVEVWDVLENGKMIGRFYLDMHPRPGKYTHAQAAPILDGIRGRQLPEVALICNFPEPTAADPGLMDYNDVVTFFHEFGHLMHHILGGQQQWAGIGGFSMESDFIEAPSQMLEEWMHSPQVLAFFARNYKTGEPIPVELVARMNRAFAFGRATEVSQQNAAAAYSFSVYKTKPENVDLDALCVTVFAQYMPPVIKLLPVPFYASFNHLAGYSSAYYTYMFDKVIAEDFFQQFDQQNLFAGDAPTRYRRVVLEPGGSLSANDLVKNFLGRPQNTAAFQRWLGEEFAPAH